MEWTISLTWTFLVGILSLVFYQFVLRYHFSDWAKIPGPFPWPIFGQFFMFVNSTSEERLQKALIYRKLYGPVFRYWVLGLPFVELTEPDELKELMASDLQVCTKDVVAQLFRPFLGQCLLFSNGDQWRQKRKRLSAAFHYELLKLNLFPILVDCSVEFADRLQAQLANAAAGADAIVSVDIDVVRKLSAFSMDVIGRTGFGYNFGAQADDTNAMSRAMQSVLTAIDYRVVSQLPDFLFYRMALGRQFMTDVQTLRSLADRVIADRFAEAEVARENGVRTEAKKYTSLLSVLMDVSRPLSPSPDGPTPSLALSPQQLCDEVMLFLFAGHETSSVALSWTLFQLGQEQHRHILDKVRGELRDVLGSPARPPTEADLGRLKYLTCCIKESLRLNPPVPTIMRINKTPIKAGRFTIPAKSFIVASLWCMHRSKYLWGDDVNEFRPERFLCEDGRDMSPPAYLPFSMQPRNCIGLNFAMMEMKTMLAVFVPRFDFTVVKPEKVSRRYAITLRPVDLSLRITHRVAPVAS